MVHPRSQTRVEMACLQPHCILCETFLVEIEIARLPPALSQTSPTQWKLRRTCTRRGGVTSWTRQLRAVRVRRSHRRQVRSSISTLHFVCNAMCQMWFSLYRRLSPGAPSSTRSNVYIYPQCLQFGIRLALPCGRHNWNEQIVGKPFSTNGLSFGPIMHVPIAPASFCQVSAPRPSYFDFRLLNSIAFNWCL